MRIEADGYNVKNVTTKYWKDRTNSEIDIFATSAKGQENNLVKIAVLGGARREATIGSSEELKGTGIYTEFLIYKQLIPTRSKFPWYSFKASTYCFSLI